MQTETIPRWLITTVLDSMGLDGDAVRENYTGRSFNEECFGLVIDTDPEAFEFFANIGEADGDLARKLARNARTDNFGRSMIVYFPRYTLADEDD